MITVQGIEAAVPLTMRADLSNVVVSAVPNTPLALLVKASRIQGDVMVRDEAGNWEADVDMMLFLANTPPADGAPSDFGVVMDEVSPISIKAVQEQIAFARGSVTPAIEQIANATIQSVKDYCPSALLAMEVLPIYPPAPFETTRFEEIVKPYESAALMDPKLNFNMQELPVSELLELLKTGSASLDEPIGEWAALKGEGFFVDLWKRVFTMRGDGANESFRSITFCNDTGHNALAIFLWARRLLDDPSKITNSTRMTLNGYKNAMADFRDQAGLVLFNELRSQIKYKSTQSLVLTKDKYKCYVNGPVYRTWIDQGGSNEILFGSMLQSNSSTLGTVLLEQGATLAKNWHQHVAFIRASESNRKFDYTKEFLLGHFKTWLAQDEAAKTTTPAEYDRVAAEFTRLMSYIREEELEHSFYEVVLRLVCQSRWPQSAAYDILRGITRAKKNNPDIDVREAATVSVFDYVTSWVASQFKVEVA